MTEVPEHLLQRSRDRRKALGLGGGDDGGGESAPAAGGTGGSAAPAAATPAAAPSLPAFDIAPAKPTPPAPTKPWVEAARKRKRIPSWVMPVLLFLPLWAFIYFGTLEEPEQGATGLLAEGAEVYEAVANCAQCHGAGGAGSNAGPQLSAGEVLITFPADPDGLGLAQQIEWVVKGTNGIGVGTPYGSPERGHVGGWFGVMPGFGESITAEQLLAVVLYERVEHGMSAADETLATILLEQIEAGEIVLPENWPLDVTVEDIQATLAPAFAATGAGESAGGEG